MTCSFLFRGYDLTDNYIIIQKGKKVFL